MALTKKIMPDRESLNFTTSEYSICGEETLTDNKKLWDYIRKKRNCDKKEENFIEVLSQGLARPSFEVNVIRCKTNANNNITQSNSKNSAKKNSNKSNCSPVKHHMHSQLKRITRSFGKRVLLKEFEKTLENENEFHPSVASTPVCFNAKDKFDDANKHNTTQSPDAIILQEKTATHGVKKNMTILDENSMEISDKLNSQTNKHQSISDCEKISLRTRQIKRNAKTPSPECDKELNGKSNTPDKTNKNCDYNIDFTVIPNTQEESDDSNEANNQSVEIIPETQETADNQNDRVKHIGMDIFEIEIGDVLGILQQSNEEDLEAATNNCKSKDLNVDVNCDAESTQSINYRKSDLQEKTLFNNISSPKKSNVSEAAEGGRKSNPTGIGSSRFNEDDEPPLEVETFENNDNGNPQIEEPFETDDEDIYLSNIRDAIERESIINKRQTFTVTVHSPPSISPSAQRIQNLNEMSPHLRKGLTQSPSRQFVSRSAHKPSRIPQIKRMGKLALMKPPSPCPKILSTTSTLSATGRTMHISETYGNETNENDTGPLNSTHMEAIVNELQKSTAPASPIVILIDNNRNMNENRDREVTIPDTNISLPPPPAEFCDSMKNSLKKNNLLRKVKVPLAKMKIMKKVSQNLNEILTSDDDDVPRDDEHLDKTADLTEDSMYKNAKTRSVGVDLIRRSKIHNNENMTTAVDNLVASFQKLTPNKSANNNSKIFVPQNFTVQPIDLRKKNFRTSIGSNSKNKELNNLTFLTKNSVELSRKCKEIIKNSNHLNSNQRKSLLNIIEKEDRNPHTSFNPPLINVFRELNSNQSFSQILKTVEPRSRKSFTTLSNLPSPPSFLLRNYEYVDENYDITSPAGEFQSRRNSISHFQQPTSSDENNFAQSIKESTTTLNRRNSISHIELPTYNDENNFVLPIKESITILNDKNKRLKRYYKFLLENERIKNQERIQSHKQLHMNDGNFNVKNVSNSPHKQNAIELDTNITLQVSENNYTEEPLPPAEAYDRPNEIVIEMPQIQETSSGYASAYFKKNKRKKSLKNRQDFDRKSTSSSDSPEPKVSFRQRHQQHRKVKSLPLIEQPKSNQEPEKFGSDSSISSDATTTSQAFECVQNDLNMSNQIMDNSKLVNSLWKKSFRTKIKEKEKCVRRKSRSRVRPKKDFDSLKKKYIDLTQNAVPAKKSLGRSSESSSQRKLFDKGYSEGEEDIADVVQCSAKEDYNTLINQTNANKSVLNKSASRRISKKRSSNTIFNNIMSPVSSVSKTNDTNNANSNSPNHDELFKVPNLPAPRTAKKRAKASVRNHELNKQTTSDGNDEIYKSSTKRNTTHNKTSEVDKLMQYLPRSYNVCINGGPNDTTQSTTTNTNESTVRRSGRKPAPRTIPQHYKYNTNQQYELMPSLEEYTKMLKKLNIKKNNKQSKKNSNKKTDDKSPIKESKSSRKPKSKEAEVNGLSSESNSSDIVRGTEPQSANHFAEKQINTTEIKRGRKDNKTHRMPENDEQYEKSCPKNSSTKDLTQIVRSLTESFNKFESNVLSKKSQSINDKEKKSSKRREKLKSKNKVKDVSDNQRKECENAGADENSDRNNVADKENEDAESIRSGSAVSTEKSVDSDGGRFQDLFHWVRKLACNSTNINNNKGQHDTADDIQTYFDENSFRIIDINKMHTSEKDGVQYAFYTEERSKDFGYIKFKPGSKKPRTRSKSFDLHFLFIFGVLEFHIDDKKYDSKAGNFVTIPKGTNYSMVNNSDETSCLFFIKIHNEDSS